MSDPELFGVKMLEYEDVDPSYFCFAGLDRGTAKQVFVGHLLFYHLGTSA